MNDTHATHRSARIRRAGTFCLILTVIVSLLPAGAQAGNPVQTFSLLQPENQLFQGLRALGTDYRAPLGQAASSAVSDIHYPISDLKMGLWFEGVPSADVDNFRYNEIDDPAPGNDGDATYVVTDHIKSYRAGILAPSLPEDALNISVSIIWTVRYEEADDFHVTWSQVGVDGKYYFSVMHRVGTSYTTFTDTWANNPKTGEAWTPETANSVMGLGFDSNVATPVHVTQAYLLFSYETGVAASIDVEKYVWDGAAWVDADQVTGPYLLQGTNPQFEFVVSNTGQVELSNVDLIDNVFGDISLDGTLAAGASVEYFRTGTWAEGQHTNTATVSGEYGSHTRSDSDDANYFGAAPAIDVEKSVWNGTDWDDADQATGPYLLEGTDPQFKFVVTNTGNVDLGNVDLTDDVYGDIALDGTLAAGASAEYPFTGTWAEGQHTNTATASGHFGGSPYTDSDDANYFGAAPAIDVEKYVWDGTDWLDADEVTGPYLLEGTDPQFTIVVTNTGNVELSNVDLTDDVYGDISLDGTLAAGASAEYPITGTWAEGQHTNTATASGDYGGNTYTDSDAANFFGAAPAIDVEKSVWDGTEWLDADEITGPYLLSGTDPQFKFVITNTGNVDLGNVDLTDDVYGDIALDGTLAAGASAEYPITGTWAEGQHTNTATASGDFANNAYTDSDKANYFGAAPAIDVEKYVWDGTEWLDADEITGPFLPPGTDPQFKFVITNSGNVDLSNVDLTDDVYGDISLDGTLAAGASAEYPITGTWAEGQHTNTATASGDYGGNTYSDSDAANYFGGAPALTLVKMASPTTYSSFGDVISYTYQLTNTSTLLLEAPFTVTDDKVSVTCPETPLSLAPGESITCSANYTITQTDLDAGFVTNTAQGFGFFEGTLVGSNYDDETVTTIIPEMLRVYFPVIFAGYSPPPRDR